MNILDSDGSLMFSLCDFKSKMVPIYDRIEIKEPEEATGIYVGFKRPDIQQIPQKKIKLDIRVG